MTKDTRIILPRSGADSVRLSTPTPILYQTKTHYILRYNYMGVVRAFKLKKSFNCLKFMLKEYYLELEKETTV